MYVCVYLVSYMYSSSSSVNKQPVRPTESKVVKRNAYIYIL